MTQTVLLYGKASQQRIAPYIVISKRRLSNQEQRTASSQGSFKPTNLLSTNQNKKAPEGAFHLKAESISPSLDYIQ